MPKPTKLQAAAADEKSEKTREKNLGLLAYLAAKLGLADAVPSAKSKRIVEKYSEKRERMEEGGTESEAEEEEEEGGESTGSTGSEGESTGSTHDSEEEEEEEEKGEGAEEEEAESEEEEEEARVAKSSRSLAKAVSRALNSPKVHEAFLAALPAKHRAEGSLFSPHRLASAAKKATGSKTTFAAMHALSDLKRTAMAADEGVLRRLAKVETTTAKVKADTLKSKVDAMVKVAKETGKAGATTHDGREALRAYGMKHGASALTKFLASMPKVARTKAATPRGDGSTGAPSEDAQRDAMRTAAVAGITDEKERAAVLADFDARVKNLNGAAAHGTET